MDLLTLFAIVGTVCYVVGGLFLVVLISEKSLSRRVREILTYGGVFLLASSNFAAMMAGATPFLIASYALSMLIWSAVLLIRASCAEGAPKAAVKRAAPTKKKKGK